MDAIFYYCAGSKITCTPVEIIATPVHSSNSKINKKIIGVPVLFL